MGTWATGPFDNDNAADFAGSVRDCSGPEARHDLLLATLRDGARVVGTAVLVNEYAWEYRLDFALAAAAFVADEHTGRKEFTDTPYARGVDDDLELEPYVDIQLSEELTAAARQFTEQTIHRMRASRIDEEWIEPVTDIHHALTQE